MSSLHTRLTLFAVISAIEEDLRAAVLEYLGRETPANTLLAADMYAKCSQRFGADADDDDGGAGADLESLLVYADLGDLHQMLNRNSACLPASASGYISSITSNLDGLVPIRNRVCHNRPLNFEDFPTVFDLASSFDSQRVIEKTFWSVLHQTMNRLKSEPHFVLSLSIPDLDRATSRHNLPSPDFDETGFLGRTKEVREIRKLCEKGAFPVISLIGEGGLGKTAIALKVAYDLLDSSDSPFDTIVWCSSKTSQVTPREIVKITNAIGDSLELLRSATGQLVRDTGDDPLPELLQYLELFRVLIVFDNLETVLDERIRDFLRQLPMGSKVLITSRIGIGAYDFPVKLSPMEKADSVTLVRAVAKSRGVESLLRMPSNDLEIYCARLKNNPGFIKWFVSGIQAGIRPEEALSNPDVFLQFCMDNIYDHLSIESRTLLDVMLVAADATGSNQAELYFLSTLSPDAVQRGLQQLLTTNIVVMMSVPHGGSFITRYALTELAAEYLKRHHRPSDDNRKEITKKKNQVAALKEEELSAAKHANPYDVNTVRPRNTNDLIVAKMLRNALREFRRKHETEADTIIETAKTLSPDYWEVHRVEAFVNAERQNVEVARRCYEAALELEPNSAPLRFWFGGFLLRNNDVDLAVEQFRLAMKADPDAIAIRIEAARAELYFREWLAADMLLQPLLDQDSLYEREARKVWDLYLQVACRQAEHNAERKELRAAVAAYRELRTRWSQCPRHVIDVKVTDRLQRTISTMRSCVWEVSRLFGQSEVLAEMQSILDWAEAECHIAGFESQTESTSSDLQVGERCHGRVIRFEPWGAMLRLSNGVDGWLENRQLTWTSRALASDMLAIDQEIEVVVIKLRRSAKSARPTAVVSHRLTLENPWDHLLQIHPINSREMGTVIEFLPFGASVVFESGFAALVHESELSWTARNPKASDILLIGQVIPVVIQSVDPVKRKLHASYRAAIPNPWETLLSQHPIGSTAIGRIENNATYGLFVRLPNGCVGLVHQSLLPSSKSGFAVGSDLTVKVLEIDSERQRLGLGLV